MRESIVVSYLEVNCGFMVSYTRTDGKKFPIVIAKSEHSAIEMRDRLPVLLFDYNQFVIRETMLEPIDAHTFIQLCNTDPLFYEKWGCRLNLD